MPEARDGGRAFPSTAERPPYHLEEGMTLHEWYVGQALAGYIAAFAHPNAIDPPEPERAARCAYEYADAVMAVREERESS